MTWVKFLLDDLVFDIEIYRKSIFSLGFSELIRVLYEFVEIEAAILLQFAEDRSFAEDIEKFEDDGAKESDLIDDDIDIFERLGREYFRHDQSLRYESQVLILPTNLVYLPSRQFDLLCIYLHEVLEKLLDFRASLILLNYLFSHEHDWFLFGSLRSLG